MADFTALKTAINNAIKTNGEQEITGAILQVILDAMVETLGDGAINNLETAISAEIANRQNAVGGVADNLAAEVLARTNKDIQLDNRINQEEYNRQDADAALSQAMNQGFLTLGSQITALNDAISALNAAYQNGYLYGGIATPSSSPSNNKCFYIALQGGIYTNFGGVGVVEGINIIKNDSGWKVEHIYDQTTLLNEFYLLRQQVIQAITSFAPIVIEGDVTNAPDEEDLTSNANHLLQFKNNAYSPLEFSGLGRKYLRKNIAPLSESAAFNGFVEGVTAEETLSGIPTQIFWDRMNTRFVGIKDGVYYLDWTGSDNYVPVSTSLVYMYNGTPYRWDGDDFIVDEDEVPNLQNCLTQDMINEANTIYIIRYDFTLKEDITVPANCVLEFDGGSLSNGTLSCQNTEIVGISNILRNISITGTIANEIIYVDWFDSESAIINDLEPAFINARNYIVQRGGYHTLSFRQKEYHYKPLNKDYDLRANCEFVDISNVTIDGNGTKIVLDGEFGAIGTNPNHADESIIQFRSTAQGACNNITVKDITLVGNNSITYTDTDGTSTGIPLRAIEYAIIERCKLSLWGTDGIDVSEGYGHNFYSSHIIIRDCEIHHCLRQGISVTGCDDDCLIDNCFIHHISGGSFQNGIDIESNTNAGVPYVVQKNVKIVNCTIEDTAKCSVVFIRTNHVVFENNYCVSPNNYAIWVNTSNVDLAIRNNIVRYSSDAIYCNHSGNDFTVENNVFDSLDATSPRRCIYMNVRPDENVNELKPIFKGNVIRHGGLRAKDSHTIFIENIFVGNTGLIETPISDILKDTSVEPATDTDSLVGGMFCGNKIKVDNLQLSIQGICVDNYFFGANISSLEIATRAYTENNTFAGIASSAITIVIDNIQKYFINNRNYAKNLVFKSNTRISTNLKWSDNLKLAVDYSSIAQFKEGGIVRYNKDATLDDDENFSWFMSFYKHALFGKDQNGDWFNIRAVEVSDISHYHPGTLKAIDKGSLHFVSDLKTFRVWDGTAWQYPLLHPIAAAPASASATGTKGEYYIDTDYFYICVAANTWKRFALETW